MAANDRRRRAYGSTPGKVVDGNLARRLERETRAWMRGMCERARAEARSCTGCGAHG